MQSEFCAGGNPLQKKVLTWKNKKTLKCVDLIRADSFFYTTLEELT